MKNDLKVGDTIKCRDKEEMFEVNRVLTEEYGYETEFCYERVLKNGLVVKGLWVVIEGVPNE